MELSKSDCLLTNFIKIKWKISRNGTVQTRLEECCPTIFEAMRASFIPFTHSSDATVDRLMVEHEN